MPSTISAGTTAGTAIAVAGDTTGNLAFQTNGTTTAMTIDTSQNVGIGTASPARRLHVHESTAVNAYIQLSNATTGATATDGFQLITTSDGLAIVVQRENQPMEFWTNNTEQARITAAGNFQFNSGYGSVATAYGCRAWINFNGTGTPAIRASGNVTSITDNNTGDYTLNFTTAMPDGNYAVSGMSSDNTGTIMSILSGGISDPATTKTTTAVRIATITLSNTFADANDNSVAIFR
jgi:hypothetical protein